MCEKESKAKNASLENKMKRKRWSNPDPMSAWKGFNSIVGRYPKTTDNTFFLYLLWRFCRWYMLNIHVCHMYKYMHIHTYKHTYMHTFYIHKCLLLPTPRKRLDFQVVKSPRRKRSTVMTVNSLFKLPWKATDTDHTLCSLFHAKHKIHAAVAKNTTINLQID